MTCIINFNSKFMIKGHFDNCSNVKYNKNANSFPYKSILKTNTVQFVSVVVIDLRPSKNLE